MTLSPDQISNIEHKVATIVGTGMVTYAQTSPKTSLTDILTAIGGALVAWAAVKSNTLNAAPPSSPPPAPPAPVAATVAKVALILLCIGGSLWLGSGCAKDVTSNAVNADATVITGVNAAMTTWASYVNSGKATQSQVNTVSNAYSLYYQSQLIASNLAVAYASNPATNLAAAEQNALLAALQSETNIVNIIGQLTK